MSVDVPIWPAGMPLATLQWTRGQGSSGLPATSSAKIALVLVGTPFIRWTATNQVFEPFVATIGTDDNGYTLDDADGVGAFQVPPVDISGFVDAMGNQYSHWAYSWEIRDYDWRTGENVYTTGYVAPLASQTAPIDLRSLPIAPPGSPVVATTPAVTSVNGETGNVIVSGGGGSGGASIVNVPLEGVSSISYPHGFGKIPNVSFRDSAGNAFATDNLATPIVVTATFVEPTTGVMVLS